MSHMDARHRAAAYDGKQLAIITGNHREAAILCARHELWGKAWPSCPISALPGWFGAGFLATPILCRPAYFPAGTVITGAVCSLAVDCNENRYVSRANVRLDDQSDLSM